MNLQPPFEEGRLTKHTHFGSVPAIISMTETLLSAAEAILAALLILAILLQNRGTGLGGAFGGDGNVYRTKRGVEKRLHQATIIIAILFFGVALASALV